VGPGLGYTAAVIVPAWLVVVLAAPVLITGDGLVARVRWLARFNLPAAVVGGLLVALAVAIGDGTGLFQITFSTGSAARAWTWLVTTEPEWLASPSKPVHTPLLVAFFTCVGLGAGASLVRRAGMKVLLFLGAAAALAVLQNLVGVGLALWLGEDPLLGLLCGSVSMTGGHGTAMGFAPELAAAGLSSAAELGLAAATFGLVAGGLLGGPLGGWLIARHRLGPTDAASPQTAPPTCADDPHPGATADPTPGLSGDLRRLRALGRCALPHLLLVAACVKGGAWISRFLEAGGLTFPVYIGALVAGVAVRNALDLAGPLRVRDDVLAALSSVFLGWFLVIAMMGIRLTELAGAAGPMLVILSAQVVLMAAFAQLVTFPLMGRSHDAAVLAGGHCGFGLGATPSAIANMQALVSRHGPAPLAFLVVPLVGAFLIDFVNALNITVFLNAL